MILVAPAWPRRPWYAEIIKDDSRKTLGSPTTLGLTIAGSDIPSCLTKSKFDGLAVETHILRKRGLSGPVLSTLVNARMPASRLIYYLSLPIGRGRL